MRHRPEVWYLTFMRDDGVTTDVRWVVDARTRVVRECTETAARLWGYVPEELVGLNAEVLIHPDEHERARRLREEHISGDAGVWRCVRKDGTSFKMRIFVHKGVHNGRLCSFAEGLLEAESSALP